MSNIKKPEKFQCIDRSGIRHDECYDAREVEEYYTSDKYIQSLIDDGRVVIDEIELIRELDYQFEECIDTEENQAPFPLQYSDIRKASKSITQYKLLRVVSKEGE